MGSRKVGAMEQTLIVRWKLKESEAPRILGMLPELAEKTRSEEGNLSYTIYVSERDPRELILHERYVDAAAAEAHRNSEHYQRIVLNEIIPRLESREVTTVTKLA
jgi:quinol monooxygenase YgiN